MVLGGVLERIDGWKDYVNSFDPADLYSVGAFTYSAWAHEGAFKFDRLPAAGYSIYGRYRADRYRHPMYILRSNAAGGIFTVQFAWTGGYSFDFNLRADGGSSELYYAIRTDGPEPFIRLAPGECYRSPAVHAGWMFGALDDAVNTMHTHLRRSVFTLPAARGMRGGWLEAGMGAERIMDIHATKHFADTAAAVGAETLIIDAGWYCPLGKEARNGTPEPGTGTRTLNTIRTESEKSATTFTKRGCCSACGWIWSESVRFPNSSPATRTGR